MTVFIVVLTIVLVLVLIVLAQSVRVIKQYEQGVVLRFGRLIGPRSPGLTFIIPFVDVLHRVALRIVTLPIQSQGIITRDNVSDGVPAVAYFRIVDPVKSVIAIENVHSAIDQIAQTTLRKVIGQHTLDETLAETDILSVNIREILDVRVPSSPGRLLRQTKCIDVVEDTFEYGDVTSSVAASPSRPAEDPPWANRGRRGPCRRRLSGMLPRACRNESRPCRRAASAVCCRPGLALTDHDGLYGVVRLAETAETFP